MFQSSWNLPPTSTSVNRSYKDVIAIVHTIDIGMTTINLLQTATDLDLATRTRLFAFVDVVIAVHSPDIIISTGRDMFQTSSNLRPAPTAIHWVFVYIICSVDSPYLVIISIHLS